MAEIAKFSSRERQRYEASLKAYRDWYSITETSRQEGIEIGRKEGVRIGIARSMLLKGMDVALIAELTGLSAEEVKHLQIGT